MPFKSNTPNHLQPSVVTRLQRSARLDLVIGIVSIVVLIALTMLLDIEAFELLYDFSREHEEWEMDEVMLSCFWIGVGAIIYGIRRMKDIKTLNRQIVKHAYYDPITLLPNRILALDRLDKQLLRVNRHGGQVVVAFLDFNNFKAVNDSYGHNIGDELIKKVGYRLSEVIRNDETVARLGGDEFLIIATFQQDSDRDIDSLLARVVKTQIQPYVIDNIEFNIKYSIGVARSSDKIKTSVELIKAADIAMYQAKSKGESIPYVFYSEEMTDNRKELPNVHLIKPLAK